MNFSPYAKAVYGAIVASLLALGGSLATALADAGASFETLSDGQWVAAIVAGLAALPIVGSTVYATTNKPKQTAKDDDVVDDEFTDVEL
jgi:hypothetical protein